MKNITILFIAILAITGCDNHEFTQFFRNPYIVEVGELDTLKAGQWHEFKTHAKALNREEYIEIEFLGSAPNDFDFYFENLAYEKNTDNSKSYFYSKRFPGKEVLFDVVVTNLEGETYHFYPTGRSGGMIFINKTDMSMMGEIISSVKIKSNLDHKNIKLTWVSRTGK